MAEYFRRQKLPVGELFERAGISFHSLMHANTRYPQDGVTNLWELAEQQTKNQEIGFHVGRTLNIATIPIVGQSLIASNGLREGLERFFRYQRMLGEGANIKLYTQGGRAKLVFRFVGDDKPICKHTYDMAMSGTVSMIRVLAGDDWAAERILLSRAQPKQPEDFNCFYACPIEFENEENSILLRPTELESDFDSKQAFDINLSQFLLPESERPFANLLGMYLSQKLENGDLDKAHAAKAMNMSARSLQRKLAAENTSYQCVLDQARKNKALECLKVPNLSLTAIAFLCGFSDVTAFNRAFKRWLGVAPGEYRKQTQHSN